MNSFPLEVLGETEMAFKIVAARLMASTFGCAFDPTTGSLPHVWGAKFDDANGRFQQAITDAAAAWSYADETAAISTVLAEAWPKLSNAITKSLNPPAQLNKPPFKPPAESNGRVGGTIGTGTPNPTSYIPIYDSNGATVGHDAANWLYVKNPGEGRTPLMITPRAPRYIGFYACVFITVRKEP